MEWFAECPDLVLEIFAVMGAIALAFLMGVPIWVLITLSEIRDDVLFIRRRLP